jgi:serine/threonine protein kinase
VKYRNGFPRIPLPMRCTCPAETNSSEGVFRGGLYLAKVCFVQWFPRRLGVFFRVWHVLQAAQPADERSDIFALGVALYLMLTGENPFMGASFVQRVVNICQCDPVVPHERRPDLNIPKSLSAVVSKALARAPRDRFQNAFEFKSALRGSLL